MILVDKNLVLSNLRVIPTNVFHKQYPMVTGHNELQDGLAFFLFRCKTNNTNTRKELFKYMQNKKNMAIGVAFSNYTKFYSVPLALNCFV